MTWTQIVIVILSAAILAGGIRSAAEYLGKVIQDCTSQMVIFLRGIEEERVAKWEEREAKQFDDETPEM